jgi:hypothetical protein
MSRGSPRRDSGCARSYRFNPWTNGPLISFSRSILSVPSRLATSHRRLSRYRANFRNSRFNYPNISPDADIYVTEVRPGSFEADLIAWATSTLAPVGHALQQQIIQHFVRQIGARLSTYFKIGGRETQATKSDLADFMGSIQAIANDPNGSSKIEAAIFEDKQKKILAAVKFDTSQARVAAKEIQGHLVEIEQKTQTDYERVIMVFVQSNIKDTELGRRTGERAVIESISDRDFPVIYASDLAEQRIKHEIREADDNVFKKGFVVDVNVELRGGKPVAYRVTDCHQVIDLPEC